MSPRTLTARADHDTRYVLDEAVEVLACIRGLHEVLAHDPGVRLHLLQSLTRQADLDLPDVIAAAYQHGYDHHELRTILGLPA